MSQYYPKYYTVTDLYQLDQIRAWTMILAHRSEIIEERRGPQVIYRVVVNDAQGMSSVTDLFEAEFAAATEVYIPE